MLTVGKEVTRLHSTRPHHRPLLIEGKFPDFTQYVHSTQYRSP